MGCRKFSTNFKFRVSIWNYDLASGIAEDLSNDWFYAHKISQAVISGVIDEDLKQLQVKSLYHLHWLTLGCLILGFYISEHNP